MNKANKTLEFRSGIVTVALSLAALLLFFLSYRTGYYIFGQMQSSIIASLLGAGILVAVAAVILRAKLPNALWVKILTFCVTALLAAAAILLLGDRVEGIGNCILTDYDSGHGGEEAIYMSIGAVILLLLAVVFNIIGSFDKGKEGGKGGAIALYAIGCLLLLAVLIPSLNMGGLLGRSSAAPAAAGGDAGTTGGVYKISFNQGNGNVDDMPDFQFLCSNLAGMVRADSRFYIDVVLELNNGAYKLSTDSYVVEGGKRAVIGDDTGLGLVLTTVAEGSYSDNGDGTVTINKADHAVFEMQTDTYSSQMKGAAQMNVNGNDADGVYDSNDEPAVLNFVPATTFVLSGSDIVTYHAPSVGGSYTVSFNQGNGNVDDMPTYQFLCSALDGMVRADSRFYIDVALDLNNGAYKLSVDSYVVEGGKRAEVGDDTGLGLVLTTVAEGSYVENEDGTITTKKADHAIFEMQTDTYSSQMKGAAQMNVNGNDADGVYDSNDEPAVLDFVPETVWTLDNSSKAIVSWNLAEEAAETPAEEAAPAEEVNGVEIVSDDGGTTMTFYPTGTYQFYFSAYDISDAGSYTYEDGVLTLTDANGVETSADGDPIKLHYAYSQNDALTGDYTIAADSLAFQAAESESTEEVNGVEIVSDDGGTTMTFYPTGTYQFYFSAYDISDAGSYTYEDGVLTLTDANGVETSAEGDPIKLHYTYSQNDALTGDYTIPAESLAFQAAVSEEAAPVEEEEKVFGVTAYSDDLATTITLNSDGTYRFWFDAYSIEDLGTWQIADGVLTLTDANGVESSAKGNPYKLHYAYSQSDQLTGDYTISADIFPFPVAGSSIPSKDLGTTISFFADGSYLFAFGNYQIVDTGSYVFEDGVLTLTDANGKETKAEGDPLDLHYLYSQSDQLTGDYSIPAAALVFPEDELPALTAVSDDHATTLTLKGDGTYRFWFAPYEVEDLGTWQIADGVMTLVDANGKEMSAEAAPYKLHYVYSQSDQLTGDYTMSVGIFPFPVSGTSIPSDDLGTTIAFFADGSYFFAFDSYEIFDTGSYVFEDGVLTLTDVNGVEYKAEGETLKLHYGYSGAPDQLTGDFSIDPAVFE